MKKASLVRSVSITAAAFAAPAAAQMRAPDTKGISMSARLSASPTSRTAARDTTGPGVSCDSKDTAWKFFGGYQFNRNLAAELGYTDLGKIKRVGPRRECRDQGEGMGARWRSACCRSPA